MPLEWVGLIAECGQNIGASDICQNNCTVGVIGVITMVRKKEDPSLDVDL